MNVNARMQAIGDILSRVRNAAIYRGSERCARTGDGVDYLTPLDALMAREEMALGELETEAPEKVRAALSAAFGGEIRAEDLPPALRRIVTDSALDQFRQFEEALMGMLFGRTPNPLDVMRRLFAYVKKKNAALLWNMGFRDIGPLLGETHAAAAARCEALFGKVKAPWQKPAGACVKMREAQRGNANRRGGSKVTRGKKFAAKQPNHTKHVQQPD